METTRESPLREGAASEDKISLAQIKPIVKGTATIERSVLGEIMELPDEAWPIAKSHGLEAEDFSNPKHRLIFNTIEELAEKGTAPALEVVTRTLVKQKLIDKAGGDLYLTQMIDGAFTVTDLSHYIGELKKARRNREIEARAMELLAPGKLSEEELRKRVAKLVAAMNDSPIRQEPIRGDETNLEMRWTAGNYAIVAHIRRLHEKSDGKITGRLSIESTFPFGDKILYEEIFNFTSERAKSTLVNKLANKLTVLDDKEWDGLVTSMCHGAWEWLQKGNPAREISMDDIKESSWIINPLIPDQEPTIFFGPPQMGKSYLLQAMILSMYSPDAQDAFQVDDPRKVLYLDWETSQNNFAERMLKLVKGMNTDWPRVNYLHCDRPLALEVDKIKDEILEKDIGIVFIDSLAMAAGNDLNASEAATTFFAAARSLHLPVVIAAHCAKNTEKEKRSIYGSVFFQAIARNIYEVNGYQTGTSGELYVTLKHTKNNNGPLQPVQAFRFTFTPPTGRADSVTFARDDVRNIPEAAPQRPLKDRIRELLLDAGALTAKDIATNLGVQGTSVSVTLNRMLQDKMVVKLPGHKWGARTDEAPF